MMKIKLAKNFSLSEFECKDGTEVPEELISNAEKLAKNLQVLRDYIQKPITIISGYRSPKYNSKVGGAKRSQHLLARAADIKVKGMKPVEVKEAIIFLIKNGQLHPGGVGLYQTFVHYDTRGRNARWYGKGAKGDS